MFFRRVLKFGGSSVGSASRIAQIVDLVTDTGRYPTGSIAAVVVSAFQGVTDRLIALAGDARSSAEGIRGGVEEIERRHLDAVRELVPPTQQTGVAASIKVLCNQLLDLLQGISLVGECSTRTLDQCMSFGERLSACVVAHAFAARGCPAEMLDSRVLIITDDAHGNARPHHARSAEGIRAHFAHQRPLQIVTGFIGATSEGITTTLGRGGSDLTASILGAALAVDEIEIWTDVDGMLTADPRKVSKAFVIPEVTAQEAMELCHFGAKVIYPPTIQPAVEAQIPLVIRNTMNPSAPGTRIVQHAVSHEHEITGISSIPSVVLLRLEGSGMVGVAGIAARFFKALAAAKINVILITQASSEHTICCAIDPAHAHGASRAVAEEFALEMGAGLIDPLTIEEGVAIVSIVGERMRHTPGMAGRIFTALGANGVNVVAIAQGSSELNISAVVPTGEERKALNAIHDEFFLNRSKTLNLWVVGTGLIGSTLLRQLAEQRERLLRELDLDLAIRGVANSREMVCAPAGAESLVSDADGSHGFFTGNDLEPFAVDRFIAHLCEANLPNSILVDCTASDEIPTLYAKLLERSVAVVTPNKRAFSGSQRQYEEICRAARARRTAILHETCVGAALPILGTLHDLVRSGDTIQSIEAVLSGTLSFIFTSMAEGVAFSEAVRRARERGYTEPDPRDDLSGLDVARKVLILARDAGLRMELPDIRIEPLLTAEVMAWSREEFLERLPELDQGFKERLARARAEDQRLCFGARIDCTTGVAEIGVRSVSADHPFCALRGADNIVAFTTRRYDVQPLVVKGPGAGAEVTAAGVFADIIRVAR